MSLDVRIHRHNEFLEVVVTGSYDLYEAIDNFPHVLFASQLQGLSKVLIDFRELSGNPAAIEKAIYAFEVRDRYLEHLAFGGQELSVAYVGSSHMVSSYRPGMEVAKASKLSFNLFTDIHRAYEWLNVDIPPVSHS